MKIPYISEWRRKHKIKELEAQLLETQRELYGVRTGAKVKLKRHQISFGKLVAALTLPWNSNWKSFAAIFAGMYLVQNLTASALPDAGDALRRYNVPENAVQLPDANIRFRFGGEPSALHVLTDSFNLLVNATMYLGAVSPGSDAVSVPLFYSDLNRHFTKLCMVTTKTFPSTAHQAFAQFTGLEPEYTAFILEGREKAFAFYITLHEIKHCDPKNLDMEGSSREANADVYALQTMRKLPQFPNIEDLVLTGRAVQFDGEHDTALVIAAFMENKQAPTQKQITDAVARMKNWARPYAGKYAAISRDDVARQNKAAPKGEDIDAAISFTPLQEGSMQAYLRAWHDHKDKPLDADDRRAFDRLELYLSAKKTLSPSLFEFYESASAVRYQPVSAGRMITLTMPRLGGASRQVFAPAN